MNALHVIKLLYKKILWIILIPLICAITVFLLTINDKKLYTSNTTLYTGVASGYSITSTEDQRIDYFAVNNAFDNLLASAKSRETLEEVILRLLAEHLALKAPNDKILGRDGFEQLQTLAGDRLIKKAHQLRDTGSIYRYINNLYRSKSNNSIEKILNTSRTFYYLNGLKSELIVSRINASDLIQVAYTCSDPAVCLRILQLHSDIFNANYKRIKSDQTFSAVKYFETKLAEVKSRLRMSEEELKDFGKRNKIINYYEQTRYIAESKEGLTKDIYEIKVEQNASKNALNLVEKKLNNREKQITNSTNMVNLRQKISNINAQLEKARIYGNAQKIRELADASQKLEDSIRFETNRYINLNYTLETVPRQELIQEWVNNAISYDKSTAGLDVLNDQKQEYLNNIDEFAPLGSTLKRLDRQIDINEKEFLSILHGLNLARLRQSNISLNSNIVVQDKPFFPLEPLPSTRKLLVILAFIVGFVLVVSTIIGKEYLDSSIKTPSRAEKIIGLPLAGVSSKTNSLMPINDLNKILSEQLVGDLMPYLLQSKDGKIPHISFLTFNTDALLANDIYQLHQNLKSLFPNLIWLIPTYLNTKFNKYLNNENVSYYEPNISQINKSSLQAFANTDLTNTDLILYIAPSVLSTAVPYAILKNSAINLLVFNANDTWLKVHQTTLEKLKNTIQPSIIKTWLVQTLDINLESVIGEIPKERSRFRKKIRKLLALNLR